MSCSACGNRRTMRIVPASPSAIKQAVRRPAGGRGFSNRAPVPDNTPRKPVRSSNNG